MGVHFLLKALILVLIIHRQIFLIILEFNLNHQVEMMKFHRFLVQKIHFSIR
jgi:hypothetical protein